LPRTITAMFKTPHFLLALLLIPRAFDGM